MTRINLIPVEELSYQHRLAELRELPRIITYVSKYPDISNIPDTYRLGTGHMKFFKNKLLFLYKRYLDLYNYHIACRKNFNYVPEDLYNKIIILPSILFNDYFPSLEEIKISRQRIEERIKEKPNFYIWDKPEVK